MKVRQIQFIPPAPVVWATAGDFFARAGLSVETTQTVSSDHIGKGLSDGEWDVGFGVMDNVIAWNERFSGDLRIVAQLEKRMELRFCAMAASLEEAAKDVIAVDSTTNGFVLVLYRALARAGIDWRGCRYDEVGGVRHRFEAMMAGKARSSILVPPFDGMAAEKGFKVLWSVDDMAPDYPGVVVAARAAWLRANADLARHYLQALLGANAWATARQNADLAERQLTQAGYSEKAARSLVAHIVPGLEPSLAGWRETLALRRDCGLLPAEPFGGTIDAGPLARAASLAG